MGLLDSCAGNFDECTCVCHTVTTRSVLRRLEVQHVQVCCETCPQCKKNIRLGMKSWHQKTCYERTNNTISQRKIQAI
jgi:hypothetical protein